MKLISRLGILLAAAALLTGTAQASKIDYSNTAGSSISFDGASHFTFVDGASLATFQITGDDITGASVGLMGNITGTYTIGAVTTFGPLSTAPVTGTGSFVIHDGLGSDLTADLSWIDISQFGATGGLNSLATANLGNVTYSGTNATLLAIAALGGSAANTLTFQFDQTISLTNLKTTKVQTSFSGSVAVPNVPEGGETVLLLGLGLSCLAFIRRKVLA